MKVLKLIILTVICISSFGCGEYKEICEESDKIEILKEKSLHPLHIQYLETGRIESYRYRGHKYLIWDGFRAGSMIHDPNCECYE